MESLIIDNEIIETGFNSGYIKAVDMVNYLKKYFSNQDAQCLNDFGIKKAGIEYIGSKLYFRYEL